MADVFISYKRERRAHAERLAAVLEAYGFEVWWDYRLALHKADYDAQIEFNLSAASAAIVLWCSGARASSWVKDEATRANRKRKLLQALIEADVEPPVGFGMAQMALLNRWRGDPEAEEILRLLESIEALSNKRRQPQQEKLSALRAMTPLPMLEPLSVKPETDTNQPPGAAKSPAARQPSWTGPFPVRGFLAVALAILVAVLAATTLLRENPGQDDPSISPEDPIVEDTTDPPADSMAPRELPPAVILEQEATSEYYLADMAYSRGEFGEAFDHWSTSCRLGNAAACLRLGRMYLKGEGTDQSDATARSLFESSCGAENEEACAEYGVLLFDGRGGDSNKALGVELLNRTCRNGENIACEKLRAITTQ